MNSSKYTNRGSALTPLIGGAAIVVAVLFLLVKLATSGYYADVSETTKDATTTRIMPSGNIKMGDGTEPGQRTGKQVFEKVCIQCHGAEQTVAFSPKVTKNADWAPRIAKGFAALVNSAVNGFQGQGTMPAKGGDTSLSDDEVARAVAYMANQSGGNFTEPPVQTTGENGATDASASSATAGDASAGGRGQEVFAQTCFACHAADSAIPFSPKLTKNEDWAPRIKQGKETLFKHAIEGFTNPQGGIMPAKGGNVALSDDDIKAAVTYMVNQSGGNI